MADGEEEFLPLQPFVENQSRHTPKILNAKAQVLPSGQPKPVSEEEEVLNRQLKNVIAQNKLLSKIDQGVAHVSKTLARATAQEDLHSSQVRYLICLLQNILDTLKFDIPSVHFRHHQQYQQAETTYLQNTIANLKATRTIPPSPFSSFGNMAASSFSSCPRARYFNQSLFYPPSSGFTSQPIAPPKPEFNIGAWLRQEKYEEELKRQAEKEAKLAKGKEKVTVQDTPPSSESMMIHPLSDMLKQIH